MDTYLITNFKGKYRVFAELEQDTGDFPRTEDGEINDSYGDFYLEGSGGERITHGGMNILGCYVPSEEKGIEIIEEFYREKVAGGKAKTPEKMAEEMSAKGIMGFCDILDGEVTFSFRAEDIRVLDKIIKIKTKGKNISPLDTAKPKSDYEIPEKDMEKYEGLIKGIPPCKVIRMKKAFGETLVKDFDGALQRNSMDALQYFHKSKKWHKWIMFLEENRD